jgi:AcrR family transcriptional regulator
MTDRKRRRDAQENYERLIEVARRAFARQGVAASLEDIAREAELGIGTLYRHFPDRNALIQAIYEERVSLVLRMIEEAALESDAWEAFTNYLEKVLTLQQEDWGMSELFVRAPVSDRRRAEVSRKLRSGTDQLLERAKDAGHLRKDFEMADLSALFWSFGPVIEATAKSAPGVWRRHLRFFLDGLRAENATPQTEPVLNDRQIQQSMKVLRTQRLRSRKSRASLEGTST